MYQVDPLEDRPAGLGPGREDPALEALPLEAFPERFGDGVVPAHPGAPDRWAHLAVLAVVDVVVRYVLVCDPWSEWAIGLALRWASTPGGHLEGVGDELIVKNPRLVRGAAQDRSAERPIATLTEVLSLAEAVPPRYRALILTATFTGLRFGELLALRREDIDLLRRTVNVEQQLYELSDGTQHLGPPKTTAGRRLVALPPPLLPELEHHLETWTGPNRGALVFTSPEGGPIRRGNFRSRVWLPAARRAGLERLRFHDLRHTGNTLAAATGASTRELMVRMGHASPRAARIYQHTTSERDHAIAAALGDMLASAAPAPSAPVHRIRKSR